MLRRRGDLGEGRLVGALAVRAVVDDGAKAGAGNFRKFSRIDWPATANSSVMRFTSMTTSRTFPVQSVLTGTLRKRLPLLSGGGRSPARIFTCSDGMMSFGMPSVRVARCPHGDELLLGHAVANMDVVRALVGNGGFPADVAAVRAVVVAHEEPRFWRQRRAPS